MHTTITRLAVAFTFLFTSTSLYAENLQKNIIECEAKMWKALIGPKVDIEEFQRRLAWGYLSIDSDGVLYSGQENLPYLQSIAVSSFTIKNPSVRELSSTSAVIVAHVKWDGTRDGHQVSADILSSTVWIKRDGKWRAQLHTETASHAEN
ncbi:nuclear transport factor 2 family protein [Tunturiibacter lichenicola]|uniref:nuclear transport factor 2 family protein n=1 Tax=Tunturiibacter lichenicola TaxID=2051959 RepID=UPI0021B3AAD0|nr:nuclear transport factor 2 family protein [Edaphobacter lichenicola]